MAILVHDCPHCGVKHVAFSISFSSLRPEGSYQFNAFGWCPGCAGPIAAIIDSSRTGQDPQAVQGNLTEANSPVRVVSFFPCREISRSPDHVPVAAARAFVEGAESLKDGRYTAAVAMFRRTIDVATKQLSEEVRAWGLEKRIDKFAKEGLLTKGLQEWAHKIRLEGNEAMHELEEPTKEQAVELQLFTELMLTYLYTLPAKVKANNPEQAETPAK
jgi:hypothetical protein